MAAPQIQIGDGLLGDALLSSVEVKQALNEHWWCTIVCRQTEDQRIPTEDLLGQPVQIKTTDENGTEHIHFSGFVYDVSLTYEVWGSYTAHLVAVSDSYRLDITNHKQYYPAATLSTIAGIVAGRAGQSVDVNAPAGKALDYVQYGETDFTLLNRIADDADAWLRPKVGGGVEIFAGFQAGSSVAWRGDGDGLISFSLSGSMAPPSFSGSHYDHHVMQSNTFIAVTKAPVFFDGASALTSAVQSASQTLPPGFEPQRARAMTLDTYQNQLQAESERALGGAVTGEGQSRNQLLMAGNTVTITGVLDARGTYGLTQVRHQWTPTGYINHFVCTPWKNYRNPQPPSMRTWEGVVPARVTAHNDPKKMGRLQVQFFWQGDGATHWARMVSSHAGPDRGLMFMPEVGDEVAVMFEDGDPERPMIVGSLWNGVQQAPRLGFFAPLADIPENNVKRIQTKSGNRLHLIDTPGVETVHIATPHSTKLSMTEKDGVTGRPLLYIHSEGDIVLNAPNGRVHINSASFSREVGAAASSPAVPAAMDAAPAPAAGAGKPKPNCDFLKKGFRVQGNKAQFDKTRAKTALGPAAPVKSYMFPGAKTGRAAMQQTATVNGHPVQITRPDGSPAEPGTALPTDAQIANSLGAIPSNQLNYVHSVVVSPLKSPSDSYWAKTYKQPGFRSEADAGADGVVHVYPIPKNIPPILDETLVHESGHAYSLSIWPKDSDWNPWRQAMKADGRSVSTYADSSKDEDFSESLVMYSLSKGTSCEGAARALFPHRYAMLDGLLHPPPPPPPRAQPPRPAVKHQGFLDWLRSFF